MIGLGASIGAIVGAFVPQLPLHSCVGIHGLMLIAVGRARRCRSCCTGLSTAASADRDQVRV